MNKRSGILIKNIYYMLSYAFRALQSDEYSEVETEEFDNIHNLFAAILAKGIGRQLKQGLYREYVVRTEGLTTLRGKISMPNTVRKRLAQRRELVCEYDELSENNLLNQILKTTAMLLLRHGDVNGEHREDLKRTMLLFSSVEEVDSSDIPWSSVRFMRNNQSYLMLIGICQLVLEGLLLGTENGKTKLRSFLDEQAESRLFEKFIFEYYAKERPDVHVSSPQIKWMLDDDRGSMLPTMQTDIVLSREKAILVIDTKYYASNTQQYFGTHTIHSANLYQVFTYVKNKEAELEGTGFEISGMLLYARTDQAVQPDGDYRMSGNRISVRTLDLNQEFSAIADQLDRSADEFFATKDD